MERIDHILKKINEVFYDNRPKQLLDVDLMTDYVRVLYADLLEWRRKFPESGQVPMNIYEHPKADPAEADISAAAPESGINSRVEADHAKVEVVSVDEEHTIIPAFEDELAKKEQNPAELEDLTSVPAPKPLPEITGDLPQEAPSPKSIEAAITQHPEEAEVSEKSADATKSEEAADLKVETQDEQSQDKNQGNPENTTQAPKAEEAPVKEKKMVVIDDEDFPSPKIEEAKPKAAPKPPEKDAITFEPPKILDNASGNLKEDRQVYASKKDIRSVIGINDKYQFMNELFQNNKSNYEELLDRINSLDTYEKAHEWLVSEVADKNKWSKEDETFKSFLASAKKHFQA